MSTPRTPADADWLAFLETLWRGVKQSIDTGAPGGGSRHGAGASAPVDYGALDPDDDAEADAAASAGAPAGCPDCSPRALCIRCDTVLRHLPLVLHIAKEKRPPPTEPPPRPMEQLNRYAAACAEVDMDWSRWPQSARLSDGRLAYLAPSTDDLVQVALETMLRVWPRYDPALGPFGVFCKPAVKGAISDEMARARGPVRGAAEHEYDPLDEGLDFDDGNDREGGAAVRGRSYRVTREDLLTKDGLINRMNVQHAIKAVEDEMIGKLDAAADEAAAEAAVGSLDPVERAILHFQLQGWNREQIADEICISPRTVAYRGAEAAGKVRKMLPKSFDMRKVLPILADAPDLLFMGGISSPPIFAPQ